MGAASCRSKSPKSDKISPSHSVFTIESRMETEEDRVPGELAEESCTKVHRLTMKSNLPANSVATSRLPRLLDPVNRVEEVWYLYQNVNRRSLLWVLFRGIYAQTCSDPQLPGSGPSPSYS